MNFVNASLCAAAVAFGLGASASSAADSQVATLNDCMHMASQTRSALDSHQQAAHYDQARKEELYGREYCTNAFYAQGVAHYQRALQLLGVPEQNLAQKS